MQRAQYQSQAVSVVIPTWNRAYVLPRAIESVLAQSAPPGQVVVVDDGSTDGTVDLIRREFPSVVLVEQSNAGVSAARNVGIAHCEGEWIALLDSDDAWRPKKLEMQLEALDAAPDLRLCHTEEIWIRDGVRVNQMKKHAKAGGHLFQRSLKLCCISPSSAMIHRSIFEDYDLWLRITGSEEVVFVETPLTMKYGGHPDQLSRAHWGMDRFRIAAIEKVLARGGLAPGDEAEAIRVVVKKLRILVAGARKRDNFEVVAEYAPRLAHWADRLED